MAAPPLDRFAMSERPQPPARDRFPHFTTITTRWADNDAYGHVNNVVYYAYFDTAVNRHLIENGVLDVVKSPVIGLVVETQCRFFSSISFPERVEAGLAIVHLGNSSARYEIGLFRDDEPLASAVGTFVHVYVDRASNRPVAIPDPVRRLLDGIARA